MNPTDCSEVAAVANQMAEKNRQLIRWLFSGNPFYIVSAGLLLYAIYRLSIDPGLFATELGQLLFNFGAFQFYELLLVGTAIFLVRRQIRYDSALLVGLETLFALVPFILISQALLIEGHMAAALCAGAVLLAGIRFRAIKTFFDHINLPPRLLIMGGMLLLVNLGLPLLTRILHRETNVAVWEVRGGGMYYSAWLLGMPLLLMLANLLPTPRDRGDLIVEKRYFPLGIFTFWVVVTGVHLYSIGYVYGLKWAMGLVAPMAWAGAWTLCHRAGDFVEKPVWKNFLRNLLMTSAAASPLIAAASGFWTVLLMLALLNAIGFVRLMVRDRNPYAFHLLLASGVMIIAGMPIHLLEWALPDITRGVLFGYGIAGYVVFTALLSRNPKLGILGGIVVGIGAIAFFHGTINVLNIAAQLGLIFLLVHSLRWVDGKQDGARGARWIAAGLWLLHSALWITNGGTVAWAAIASFTVVVLAAYFAVRLIFGFWGPRVVPCAAMLVLVFKPLLVTYRYLEGAPAGIVALAASFVLFGVGTVAALLRHRGNRSERAAVQNTQINTTV